MTRTLSRGLDVLEALARADGDGLGPSAFGQQVDLDPDAREAGLPDYVPFLGGNRYSLELLTAAFGCLTLETTREGLLLGLVRGNAAYLGGHLREVAELVPIGRRVGISGGGARIRGMLEATRSWTGDFECVFEDQSSLLGAAILGQVSQSGRPPNSGQVPGRVTQEAVS